MNIDLGTLQPRQLEFCRATCRHVAYGGARGGGKSWVLRFKAKLLALRYAGIRICIVRRTNGDLKKNHIDILKQECKDIARYNDQEKKLVFRNGSTIFFAYLDRESDLERFQGIEYDAIFVDEATQLEENWIVGITSSCRGVNDFPKRIYYTCNPGGAGHQYIKRVFIDRNFHDNERPEDYTFIQALVQDNKVLLDSNPDYIRFLENQPYKRRLAWLEGRWDVFSGQVFEEFTDDPSHYEDRRNTHVIAPFTIPPHWRIYRSYDWGYDKPFSCGWWAVDEEGILYRIAELYGCTGEPNAGVHWPIDKQFDEITRIESEHPYLKGKHIQGVADPAIWKKGIDGVSIEEVAARHGIYFQKGDNARIPGWMQVHYRLSFNEYGIPGMYVFSTCKHFIRTIPLLQYSETVQEDVNSDGEDHIADETRYFCMMRPMDSKQIQRRERPVVDDPLDMVKDYYDKLENRSQLRYL